MKLWGNNLSIKVNKLSFFSLMFILGCNHREKLTQVKDTVIYSKPVSQEDIRLNEVIIKLLKADSTKAAIKMVDSLILKNKNDGFLFFEKGFIYEYNMYFERAISYYEKAENLGFNKKFCIDKILFCKKLINDRSHFKTRTSNSIL